MPDNSPPAIDHDTHTDSPQLSDYDVSVGVDFLSTGPVLAPHSVENTDSDNFEDACPSPLDSVSAKILCDVPLVQLNGIGRSGLCKLQASDTSLTDVLPMFFLSNLLSYLSIISLLTLHSSIMQLFN